MKPRAAHFGGGFGHGLGRDATKIKLTSVQLSGGPSGSCVLLSQPHGHKQKPSAAPAFKEDKRMQFH